MSDRIFAGVWLLLCAGGMFIAWQIHSEYAYEPVGPRPFPVGIIGLMLACSVLLLLRRPDAITWPGRRVLQRLLTMAGFSSGHRAADRRVWPAVWRHPARRRGSRRRDGHRAVVRL